MEGTQTFTCLATNVIEDETYRAMETITFDVVGTYNMKYIVQLSSYQTAQIYLFR